jgi:hypothetical protein
MITEALTLARNFGPWFAGVAIAAFLAGGVGGYKAGRLLSASDVHKAESTLAAYKTDVVQAIADQAQKQVVIRDQVRSYTDEQNSRISSLSADIHRLSDGVRVCQSVSTLVLSKPAQGTDGPGDNGQPRPAAEVLAELSARFAETADRNAAQLNALIQWLEETRKK